jgi:chemotaxis methyl-accepting protein methylase
VNPLGAVLSPAERQTFLDIVDRQFGIRGSDYGAGRLDQAVSEALSATGTRTPGELLEALSSDASPKWLYDLVEHLTVGETYFMRDPAQVAAMREVILPDLITRRARERRLRMWSAGCSTGEEPYTLAILLHEKHVADWDLTLVGTDVNRASLRAARAARYPVWSLRSTPEHVRDRYFEPDEDEWRLIEPVRKIVRFAWMNLGGASLMPPATELDLIVCRNVTIYFDDAATQRLYRALVSALAPDGWLMLGPSDPMPSDRSGLERVETNRTVLWRRRPLPRAALQPSRRPARMRQGSSREELKSLPSRASIVAELEAGLVALETGSTEAALDALRRATFRDPNSIVGHFGLARAYLAAGDPSRAQAALLHTRRLLAPLAPDACVPDTDSMVVETLRQTIQSYLDGMRA